MKSEDTIGTIEFQDPCHLKTDDTLKTEMRNLSLTQAEIEALRWGRLDELRYAIGDRDKMKKIRRGDNIE